MRETDRVLNPEGVRAYYDRFGEKQDSQGFYEDPALDQLVAHADFGAARQVFEFGCGTGRFAARLLERHLASTAGYLGCDLSPTMVGLAGRRLRAVGARARVVQADAGVRFPIEDGSVDRVVCTYVLDLLAEADIGRFFSEAHRVLCPGGRVCVASLTRGVGLASRFVSAAWLAVFRLSPGIVGGCRPIDLGASVDPRAWRVLHRAVVTPYAVPSEVLVLEPVDARPPVPAHPP